MNALIIPYMLGKFIKITLDNYNNCKNNLAVHIIAVSALIILIICRIYFYFDNAVPEIKDLDVFFTVILAIAIIDVTILIVFIIFYILKLIFKKNFTVINKNINNLFYSIIFLLGCLISILSVLITFVWFTYQLITEII